jgi:hypothetical protein
VCEVAGEFFGLRRRQGVRHVAATASSSWMRLDNQFMANLPDLAILVEPLLIVRRMLRERIPASPLAGDRAGR